MSHETTDPWFEANQRYLVAAIAIVRTALERHSSSSTGQRDLSEPEANAQGTLTETAEHMPTPPALDTLCSLFGLSPFERDVLLLCAGMEMDSRFAPLCAAAQGDAQKSYPTFSLALAALPGAHWSALSPGAPLRLWRLIEAGAGNVLTASPLRIDERILHYLAGVQHLDERLVGLIDPVSEADCLVPSHETVARRLAITWTQVAEGDHLPAIQLCGDDGASLRAIATCTCISLGLVLHLLPALAIPHEPRELEALARLWEREMVLSNAALMVECGELDLADPGRESAITRFVEKVGGAVILAGRERRLLPNRPLVVLEVSRPDKEEQRTLWQAVLATTGKVSSNMNGRLDGLVTQFSLNTRTVHAACADALGSTTDDDGNGPSADELTKALWQACRVQARPKLENLAQHIEPVARWDDLVLAEAQKQILREIAFHVKNRLTVYEQWGFAAKGKLGLGISALFTGGSGTGKTMAAEVLSNDLSLDLFRIDLSQVVSKYIGETEKNLRSVFDAAEAGGAILLFDEADALFGKRSEVKDSHDRYANIEISYLLQRMEAYRGLAILTTNMKEALDPSFLRRIRFVVQFPFPDAAQRAEIWRHIFPAATPTNGLDATRLARLNLPGGNIRNIALYAAFLAAEAGDAVGMTHLLRAARVEYAKLERPLTEAEIGGWK